MPPLRSSVPAKKNKGGKTYSGGRSEEKAALDKKFLAIILVLVTAAVSILITIGIVIHKVISERRHVDEAGPSIVNYRPPELLQPFVCDIKSGFHSGETQAFVKNMGNARGSNIVATFTMQLVPERKVGIPAFDHIPGGDCGYKPSKVREGISLAPGQESSLRLPQPKLTMPPLLEGETTQLYGVSCAYYSDGSGAQYGICDTYRFRLAGGNPVFVCDGTPKTGSFDPASVANCGN